MRETLKTNLVNTLTEGGVVLEDKAVDKVLDALIAQKVLEIKKFKNLEGLTLGTTPPVAAFLINGFIVSVYAQSQEQKKYWAEYMEQVRENDVCEYEFTYEEFLRSKDLLDEINKTITVNNYFVTVDKAGKIYLSMKKRKETLEGELAQINTALPIIVDEINKIITVNNSFVTVDKAGKICLSMKKRKETLKGELAQINTALPIIEPVIKDVFPM